MNGRGDFRTAGDGGIIGRSADFDIRSLFEEEFRLQLSRRPDVAERLDAVVQISIDGPKGGTWSVDARSRSGPPSLVAGPRPDAEITVRIAEGDFRELISGSQRWTDAYIHGRVKVSGDLVRALQIRKLFASLD